MEQQQFDNLVELPGQQNLSDVNSLCWLFYLILLGTIILSINISDVSTFMPRQQPPGSLLSTVGLLFNLDLISIFF